MKAVLKNIYSYQFWRQRICLEENYYTPGFIEIALWKQLNLPESMNGLTFLDVGANDGMFSFEAEKRGATSIVASDLYKGSIDTMKNGWARNGIDLLRQFFNSKVKVHEAGIYGLDQLNQKFDVVLVNNVIVWLEDERKAIEQLANVTKGTLYLADGFLVDDKSPKKEEAKKGPMRFMYNLSYMKAALIEHGFKIDSVIAFNNQKVFTHNFIHLPQVHLKAGTKIYTLPDLDSLHKLSAVIKDQANYIMNDFYHLAEVGWVHKNDVDVIYSKPSILYKVSRFFGVLKFYYQYLQNKHIKKNGNSAFVIKASKKN
jgi:SAM-dependent methyltransferase